MNRLIQLLLAVAVGWPWAAGAQTAAAPEADPRIKSLVAAVSEQRLRQLDTALAGFVTRQTLSDSRESARAIGAARQWIYDELKRSSPKLQVSFDTYVLAAQGRITREVELRNVMAVLPGRSARRVYVSGHYDSLNMGPGLQMAFTTAPADAARIPDPQVQPGFDSSATAPGANDDGSGTALTRAFCAR